MQPHPKLLAAASLLVAACSTTPPGRLLAMRPPELPSGPPTSFTRQGEIQYTPIGTAGSSAAWDARSVRGPAVNLTLTEGGLWGGTIQDRAVLLHARNGRITGEGVNVWVTQDGPVLHVQGLWFNQVRRDRVHSGHHLGVAPHRGVRGRALARAGRALARIRRVRRDARLHLDEPEGRGRRPGRGDAPVVLRLPGSASGAPGLRLPSLGCGRGCRGGTRGAWATSSMPSSGGPRWEASRLSPVRTGTSVSAAPSVSP